MKICTISDTHTFHQRVYKDLIPANMIIHSGDIMSDGYHISEMYNFLEWYSSLPYEHHLFIAGNHDRIAELYPEKFKELLSHYPNIIYLENNSVVIEDIKFYGSPYQPWFHSWAFNKYRGEEIAEEWAKIDVDTNVLITHGPPYGFGDEVNFNGKHLGCEELIKKIEEIKPKYSIFGHIHTGEKISTNGVTTFINASNLNENYEYEFKPTLIEI